MADAELILLRHGLAEPRSPGLQDGQRALTHEGHERTQRICRRARLLGLNAPCLISSPLVRARQTAELAVEAGLAPALVCSDALAPGADPLPLLQDWWGRCGRDPGPGLILVGHEPDLGDLACRLMAAPPGAVALKKAGIALLAWSQASSSAEAFPLGQAQLRLLLTPKVLTHP